jgi:hypothetical protein
MASVEDRCKTALDETRTLMLGAQVLLGFQFNAFFQQRFSDLTHVQQALWLATLVGMMVSLAALLSPIPYDRMVSDHQPVERFESLVTRCAELGLLPFALALGANVYVAAASASAAGAAPVMGVTATLTALLWWYGIGGWRRMRQPKRQAEGNDQKPAELKDKIQNVLTEARTALPGAQALLGFQFVVVLTSAFSRLPGPLQQLHVAALLLTALTTLLLIAPAAYHRIADDGDFTEDALKFSSRVVVASLAPLGLGLCADLYVVTWMVAKSTVWAMASSCGVLLLLVAAWLVYPLWIAQRRHGDGLELQLQGADRSDRPRARAG